MTKKIDVYMSLSISQRKYLLEVLRLDKYRKTQKFIDSIMSIKGKTALEIEREFEKDNPSIIIKLLTEDIKVSMTPKLYVLQNTAIYKMKLVVTRGKKTTGARLNTIWNILKRY